MRKYFVSIGKKMWQQLIGQKLSQSLIKLISKLADVNLLLLSYSQMGILNHENSFVSGEQFVIRHILRQAIKQSPPLFFDVGANKGIYSVELRSEFPTAHIFSFEPNPYTFKILQSKLQLPNDHCYCLGFGSAIKNQAIYTYGDSLDSGHASIYKDVLKDIHHAAKIVDIEIEITTVDDFCEKNHIEYIDFLKIDAEGNELAILKGASRMVAENRIGIIQFEFNEMNVISRSFLKDFYSLLNNFDIFRINTQQLIPVLKYDTTNEIFKFQNFLAIIKHTSSFKLK